MVSEKEYIEIYTDGACRGNPGPGGWGAYLKYKSFEKEIYGYEAHTTNNRMELTAAIKALEAVKKPIAIHLYTDSTYVRSGIMTWIHDWKKDDWRIAKKKDIKNLDLWQELYDLTVVLEVTWHWVKGHSGHVQNEYADKLANRAIDEAFQK